MKHLNSKANNSWINILKRKLYFVDVTLIVVIVISSQIISLIINKLEIIEVFNIHLFKGFTLNHLSRDQLKMLYVVFSLVIVMGVIAEEFYFRAYLFTKQYDYFKKTTWLINGLSWSVYHIFPSTNILMILPISFVYSYIFQKQRNIWITIIAHFLSNYLIFFFRIKNTL